MRTLMVRAASWPWAIRNKKGSERARVGRTFIPRFEVMEPRQVLAEVLGLGEALIVASPQQEWPESSVPALTVESPYALPSDGGDFGSSAYGEGEGFALSLDSGSGDGSSSSSGEGSGTGAGSGSGGESGSGSGGESGSGSGGESGSGSASESGSGTGTGAGGASSSESSAEIPMIDGFSWAQEGDYFRFTGAVTDDKDPTGLTITFGDLLDGQTCVVGEDNSFSFLTLLDPSTHGTVTAVVQDADGFWSRVETTFVS